MNDDELTRALGALPAHDLDPTSARAIEQAALRVRPHPIARIEPAFLTTLASVHLLWLLLRVFAQ